MSSRGIDDSLSDGDLLDVAGWESFSSADWPGHLTTTVFLQGCPWKCTYCHNPRMQNSRAGGAVAWSRVIAALDKRRSLLDGVVFSGGEPTRQRALMPAMQAVKRMGYGVALHTSGAYPKRLSAVIAEADWVGFDIKAAHASYARVTGVAHSGDKAWESLDVVLNSGVDYEVRLTVDPTVHSFRDVADVVEELRRRGARLPVLQEARADGANPGYASQLAGRGLDAVLPPGTLPGLVRR